MPAAAQVLEARIIITTSYSSGATLRIGDTSGSAKYMTASQNSPQAVAGSIFTNRQSTNVGGAGSVARVTVGGSPGVGAGFCEVIYSVPNA